ncbi:MAG: CorA family divalent cation transporter [Steroidobacteraceae bacterium]
MLLRMEPREEHGPIVGSSDLDRLSDRLQEVQRLLNRRRLVETLVSRQEMPRHGLVEAVVHRENVGQLSQVLNGLDAVDAARILEALSAEDRLFAWELIHRDRLDAILALLLDEVREDLINASSHHQPTTAVSAFDLHEGRLRHVAIRRRADLEQLKPIWVDLVAPSAEVRYWVGQHFGIALPDPERLTDLEASARYFVEDDGAVHLHSDFLLDAEEASQIVPVAFLLHGDVLFSIRGTDLPVFRLQRLRARSQPGYVAEGRDVLIDLYAADVEYSADVLESVYADLEASGRRVLKSHLTDDAAAQVLAEIARGEDLIGRMRRNVLETRRALSFLMRSKLLSPGQMEESRQIVRDIESVDGHTTYLFGKINFLMDATVGFININQNRRVSKLTSLSVVFLPINILAGVGGMSEYTMMTSGAHIGWPVAYAAFVLGAVLVGWGTYHALKLVEAREAKRLIEESVRPGGAT